MSATTPDRPRELWYTCSYVPEEIILAAGFRPRRFVPESGTADAWIHPNTCAYVKSILAAGLDAGDFQAAGIIVANSCDAMRRLYDLWTEYVPAVPAFFLDLPKKRDKESIAFFASELKRLTDWLHIEIQGTAADSANLAAAARTCNEIRSLMAEVFRAQCSAQSNGLGTRVFDLCLAGTRQPKSDFATEIRRLLASVEQKSAAGKRRIVVAGGLINKCQVVSEIERGGARVVALDTCIGRRHYEGLVDEDAQDPIVNLAKRYLTRPACARVECVEDRIVHVKRLVDDTRADGVVLCSLKFCDPYLYDAPLIGGRFREFGIPFLWIEHDYAWSAVGQLKTRIAAFLELTQ